MTTPSPEPHQAAGTPAVPTVMSPPSGDPPDAGDHMDADQREIARYADILALRQPRTPAVNLLVLLNCGVFLVFALATGGWVEPEGRDLIRWGSNYGLLSLDGQWWRLLSATFLHSGFPHLLVNMLTLWAYGATCERMFGTGLFAVIYLAGGAAASIASLLWNPLVHSVGASGAIFALIGASFAYMIDRRNEVPFSVLKDHLYTLAGFAAYSLADVARALPVDHAAHAGGVLAGICIGALMSAVARDRSAAHHLRLAAITGGLLVSMGLLYLLGMQRLDHQTDLTFRARLQEFASAEEENRIRLQTLRAAPASAERTAALRELAEQYRRHQERFATLGLPGASPWKPLAGQIASYAQARQFALEALYDPEHALPIDWEAMAAAAIARLDTSALWRSNVPAGRPARSTAAVPASP